MDLLSSLEGIELSPLKIIKGDNGSVLHALKKEEEHFAGFGEVYFSTVKKGIVKGWKKHTKMISNLLVVSGEVQFAFYDDREDSKSQGKYFSVKLSRNNYQRLTVQPGLWMAFKGLGDEENILMNFASIQHDPKEATNDPVESSNLKFPHF